MTRTSFLPLFIFLLAGCSATKVERQLTSPETLLGYGVDSIGFLKASPFLKAHMNNGNLYVFSSWDVEKEGRTITGIGILLDPMRDTVDFTRNVLGLDSVAILETNVLSKSGAATAITVLTGITVAVTIFCITNPKTCFGSCPTFYASDGDSLRLQAECFSSSISPSLEATDIDALYHVQPVNGEVTVKMRNEALETHVVRHVDLLAVPRKEGSRVFAGTDGQFWKSPSVLPPASAASPEGDCLPALLNADWNERFSLTDETDLSAKETIELEFRVVPGREYGLVVGSRQSLMPTYLLYQALAYMGSDAGHWLAEIERKNITSKQGAIKHLIGGIEIATRLPEGAWQSVGGIDEHGPLAVDMHMTPLGRFSDTTLSVQLRMTKGAWRLDYVALAELSGPLLSVRLHPRSVFKEGEEDKEARAILLDTTQTLVTLPGDSYDLQYTLPGAEGEYELFLESRGYYLEWIRKEWIEEQNPLLLAQMFLDPGNALKRLAPEFKRVEQSMEDCFWRSRYAKP